MARLPKVLLIGSGTYSPGVDYAKALRAAGCAVFFAGRGLATLRRDNPRAYKATKYRCEFVDLDWGRLPFHDRYQKETINKELLVYKYNRIPLHTLLKFVGDDFDLIFHVQDPQTKMEGLSSPLPYYYSSTEPLFPQPPRCAGTIYWSTRLTKQELLKHVGVREGKLRYLPYCLHTDLEAIPEPGGDRPVDVAWAGQIYKFEAIYRYRAEVIKYLQRYYRERMVAHYVGPKRPDGRLPVESGRGSIPRKEYHELLSQSKVGINISDVGLAFRDLEVPGHGAMLVARETPDHADIGFEDGVNCRFFRTPQEALQACQAYSEDIARAGQALAKKHTYSVRVQQLLEEWKADGSY